eukprot:7490619-Pyramimonas_sp.AAC.1
MAPRVPAVGPTCAVAEAEGAAASAVPRPRGQPPTQCSCPWMPQRGVLALAAIAARRKPTSARPTGSRRTRWASYRPWGCSWRSRSPQ